MSSVPKRRFSGKGMLHIRTKTEISLTQSLNALLLISRALWAEYFETFPHPDSCASS